MKLRDQAEALIRGWDQLERAAGRTPVIDFDCAPHQPTPAVVENRATLLSQLQDLHSQATEAGDDWVASRIEADVAYLAALIGERLPLDDYVSRTQGCGTQGWSADYIAHRKDTATAKLDELGIPWNKDTISELEALEGPIDAEEATERIRSESVAYEQAVRSLTETDADFELSVEQVDVEAYWAYWIDGVGNKARLRINMKYAKFTTVRATQFALHEVLGHALQGASYYQRALVEDVPWVRLLSVHAPQQVMLEGLAQAMPLFVAPDDKALAARVHLDHYTQLIRSELHRNINNGSSASNCINHAQQHVPYWSASAVTDILNDRSNNPQLRSYLWSYPAGLDWFVNLAEQDTALHAKVFQAAYQSPLQPDDLANLWSSGPTIGGPGKLGS